MDANSNRLNMPIKSYLVYPHEDQWTNLQKALNEIDQCDIAPAKNEQVLVLVTETHSKEEENQLIKTIESIPSLKAMSMVSGFENN